MHELDHKQKITIMLAIMAAVLFAALNQTIVGTALPRIITDLGGIEYFSWVFTIYMLASTVPAIIVGKLSDIYGRKPFLLTGIAVFICGSILSGLADSIIQLIIYRGIQGMGAGAIMATSFSAVGDLFPPRERGKWQGMLGAMFGLASVFGPTLGGYIVDHMHWKWVFWVFIPVGAIAFGMIWVLFPGMAKKKDQTIDYLGSLLLVTTIVPMLLGFSWAGQKYDWLAAPIVFLFITTVVSLTAFIYVERRARHPALPLHLFNDNVFTMSNAITFIIGAGMFGAIMYMPFFLQGVLGTSAALSGYMMIPMTFSLVIGSIVSGRVMSGTGKYKTLAIAGMFIIVTGMYSLSTITPETSLKIVVADMVLTGIGIGIGMPVFTMTVQNSVDHEFLGVATSSVQLFRQLGGTIGVAIMGSVLSISMSSSIKASLAESGNHTREFLSRFPPDMQKTMESPQFLLNPDKLQIFISNAPEAVRPGIQAWVELMRGALGDGLSHVFLTGAIAMILAVCLSFLLKEIPLRSTMDRIKTGEADGAETPAIQQ